MKRIIFFALTILFSLNWNCGDYEIYNNRKGDKNRRENYRNRLLLCYLPYKEIRQISPDLVLSNRINYFSSFISNSNSENKVIYPNVGFTIDNGKNWKYFINQEAPINTTIWDDSLFYVLSSKSIFVTENSGLTWQKYPSPADEFSNEDIFMATGLNELVLIPKLSDRVLKIYSSIDRGKTWKQQSLNASQLIYFKGQRNGIYRILLTESSTISNVKLYTSSNFGQNWNLTYTFSTGSTLDYSPDYLYFYTDLEGFASGGTSIFKTTNGGSTWIEYPQNYPLDYTSIFFADSSRILSNKSSVRTGNSFPKFQSFFSISTNNGQTWSEFITQVYNFHEVFSSTEILGTSSRSEEEDVVVFNSFSTKGIKTSKASFKIEKETTGWESQFITCWLNAANMPDTGTRTKPY
ncbi:MAG: hypothetical protein SFU98_07025 [Leptospiraceae bacterium]|nr:hypothetical protein [Leptospiraceae bacterium]